MFTRSRLTRRPIGRRLLRAGVAAGAVAALVTLGACGTTSGSPMPGMSSGAASTPAAAPPAGASPAAGPHNDADVMFAQMMIPHHQQAVEMSQMLLDKTGVDDKVTALARQIKDAQAPEIATMSGWLAGWGQDPSPSGMDHDMGGGMMSQLDMEALENASGDDAARLFLTGMTKHHQGAIAMAQQELADGQNPEAKQLAQNIIDTQRAEIDTMKQLLDHL